MVAEDAFERHLVANLADHVGSFILAEQMQGDGRQNARNEKHSLLLLERVPGAFRRHVLLQQVLWIRDSLPGKSDFYRLQHMLRYYGFENIVARLAKPFAEVLRRTKRVRA